MAKVITLDGLTSKKLGSLCDEIVEITSPVLRKTYFVCKNDLERISRTRGEPLELPGEVIVEPARLLPAHKRGRGRPKGTSVKSGAKRPRVTNCSSTKVIVTRTGREVCKCADKGNAQILPRNKCRQ